MHAYLIGLHPRTRGHPLGVLLPFLCFSVIIKKEVLANPALHADAMFKAKRGAPILWVSKP